MYKYRNLLLRFKLEQKKNFNRVRNFQIYRLQFTFFGSLFFIIKDFQFSQTSPVIVKITKLNTSLYCGM
jgi:hypothetical protein